MTRQNPKHRPSRSESQIALRLRRLVGFISKKEDEGIVSEEHFEELMLKLLSTLREQGYLGKSVEELLALAPEQAAATSGVIRQAFHVIKQRFLTLYPNLAEELTNAIESGQAR